MVIENFITHLLAYGQDSGIIGKVKSYYAMIEGQDRGGSLHAHFLIWLAEHFNPYEYREQIKKEILKKN
jgi:hypothetical protein